MSQLPRAVSRALVATGVAIALGSASLLGAGAAGADETDDIVAANSGTIIVRLPGDAYASATVVVLAATPGTGELNVVSAPVEPEADSDGYVAELSNFAGPVLIEIDNGSSVGSTLAETGEADLEANAGIFRGQVTDYTFNPETGQFVAEPHALPTPPSSQELESLIPFADYTFTPTSYEKGTSFTIAFRDITSLLDGHTVGGNESHPVWFYGYSEPVLLAESWIDDGSVDFTVPAAYTTAPHEIAAFDEFGRINLWVTLDGGLAAPVDDPAQAAPAKAALANTGAGDTTGFVAAGVGALVLGAGAVVTGVLLRTRRTVKA